MLCAAPAWPCLLGVWLDVPPGRDIGESLERDQRGLAAQCTDTGMVPVGKKTPDEEVQV